MVVMECPLPDPPQLIEFTPVRIIGVDPNRPVSCESADKRLCYRLVCADTVPRDWQPKVDSGPISELTVKDNRITFTAHKSQRPEVLGEALRKIVDETNDQYRAQVDKQNQAILEKHAALTKQVQELNRYFV